MKERKNEALEFLLERYKTRLDLKDAFPEVKQGQYQALINWANAVASNQFEDNDNKTLSTFENRVCPDLKSVCYRWSPVGLGQKSSIFQKVRNLHFW